MKIEKKCTNCEYCVEQDMGGSTWDVLTTIIDCLLDQHPIFPADKYIFDTELFFAERCDFFSNGHPVCLDVEWLGDFPNGYTDALKISLLLEKWRKKNLKNAKWKKFQSIYDKI